MLFLVGLTESSRPGTYQEDIQEVQELNLLDPEASIESLHQPGKAHVRGQPKWEILGKIFLIKGQTKQSLERKA